MTCILYFLFFFFHIIFWSCLYVCMCLNLNPLALYLLANFLLLSFWAITVLCEFNIKAICSGKHAPLSLLLTESDVISLLTCCELVVAATSVVVRIIIMGAETTLQSSYQALYPSLLFLYQSTGSPGWKVTSGAFSLRQGQRSALRSLYHGRSCRKLKCWQGRAAAMGSFLQ